MAQRQTQTEQPSTIDQDKAARQKVREANEAAFKESIKGQEMPPSYAAAEEEEQQRRKEQEEAVRAAQEDERQTSARIAEMSKEG